MTRKFLSPLNRHFLDLKPAPPSNTLSTIFSTKPNTAYTPSYLLHLLSSCNSLNLNTLFKIHALTITSGYSPHIPITTRLINSYSSLKRCDLSRLIFDSIQNPEIILWNSMIRAYTHVEKHKEALELYCTMKETCLEPDKHTFTFVLKACTGALDLQLGILVHEEVRNRKLELDQYIGTGLIDMYGKMGEIEDARKVFDELPQRDVVVWNAMIAGAAQGLDPKEALELFQRMVLSGLRPNSVSLLNLFPGVSRLMDIGHCRCIHGYVVRRVFRVEVLNGLIDMYSKCGDVEAARRVFDLISYQDDTSWGTMMAGYAHNGYFFEVLEMFDSMKERNIKMGKVSAISALLAAGEIGCISKGKEAHDFARQEVINSDVMLATSIMTMYAKCGDLDKARCLFDELQGKDLVAWSALIAAFVQSGYPEKSLSLFRDMQREKLKPNRVTLVSILPACAELLCARLGKSIHCFAIKADMDTEIPIGTALVSMYAKCGYFNLARTTFDRMPCRDTATWNALINGYAQLSNPYCAIKMFQELQVSQTCPDAGTMVGLLPACALLNNLKQGTCVHALIIKSGFECDNHVKNALIDMYAKCGSPSAATYLFEQTNFLKDEVSWNVMIAGYMHNGDAKKALSAFRMMKSVDLLPNEVTFVSVLPAAASLAALREGKALHACIIRMGYFSNTVVGNSLIDMYAKCGRVDLSEKCFYDMVNKDTVSWNTMLAAYAVNGQGNHAVEVFSLMRQSHVLADSVSYLNVLSACRHAGLVEEGRKIFYSMQENPGLQPNVEHYACMIDLLGRTGLFDEISSMMEQMPMEPDAGVWGALLGACRMHSNSELGEIAVKRLVELEPGNPTHYVVLSNIYAQSGSWSDAGIARSMMSETGLKKHPGFSWVETESRGHAFQVGG